MAGHLLRAAVTAVLLGIVAWTLDLTALTTRATALAPGWIAAAFATVFAAVGLSALKWGILLRRSGHPLPFRRLLRHYVVGLFFNNLLPTTVGGDVVRAWETVRDTGEIPHSVGSVVAERLIASVGLGITAVVGLPLLPFQPQLVALVIGFLLFDVAVAGVFLLPRVADRIVLHAFGRRLPATADTVTATVASVRRALSDRGPALIVLCLSVLFQFLVAVVNWCLFKALGIEVSLGACIVYTPMIFTITMIPVSLSGFGVREATYWSFFAQTGVGQEDAVLASLLFFLVVAIASLPGAPLFAFGRRARTAGNSPPYPPQGAEAWEMTR